MKTAENEILRPYSTMSESQKTWDLVPVTLNKW